MAIQYLDSKRIRGNLELTPTWTADFSQTGTNYEWLAQDETTSGGYMKIDTANSELDYKAYRDNTNDAISFDLQQSSALGSGNNVHATAWVLRVQIDLDDIEDGHANGLMFSLGLSSENSTVAQAGNQDGIVIFAKSSSSSEETDWTSAWSNNQAAVVGANTQDLGDAILAEGRWYIEIKRTDSDKATVRVTRSSDYTGGYSHSYTDLSGVDNLRYFKACNNAGSEMTNYIEGKIKSIKLWNGVTSATIDDKASLVTAAVPASTGWNLTGTPTQAITGGVLDTSFTAYTSGHDGKALYDLDADSSLRIDGNFVIRFKLKLVANNNNGRCLFVLSETIPTGSLSGETTFGIDLHDSNKFRLFSSDSNQSLATSSMNDTAMTVGTQYYVQFKRDGNVLYAEMRSGSYTGTLLGSAVTLTLNGTTNLPTSVSMRYIGFRSLPSGIDWVASGADIQHDCDEMLIYDNQTGTTTLTKEFTFSDIPVSSDLPENTLFEETDTYTQYWLQDNIWKRMTYSTDFSSDDFSDTGSKIVVNTGSGTFTWDGIQDGSTHGSTKDLTSISDTAWVIRFKLRINTLTAPNSASNRVTIGLFSTHSATAGDINQDGIGLMIQNDTSTNQFWAQYRDGGNLMNGVQTFALTPATGTDYYVEIKRLTSTTGSVAIFPNNTYGTATETESITVSATTDKLRYFGAKIRTGSAVGGTFDGYIDDLEIRDGVTSF